MFSARRLLSALPLLFCAALTPLSRAGEDWPQFRGPSQQGVSDSTGVPTEWSETRNVQWKTAIPGLGWSSPVVLDGKIWLTTATDLGDSAVATDTSSPAPGRTGGADRTPKSLRAVCVDPTTGKILHDVEVFTVRNPAHKNDFNSYASPTPVLESGRVYLSFGTYGSACLDANTGQVLWRNQDMRLDHGEGPGSSPILYKDLFILNCDGTDVHYVVALDKHTGKVAWKTNRSHDFGNEAGDFRKAFSVPTVIPVNGKDQLVSVGARCAYAYAPADGREVWHCDVPGFSVVPRPAYGDGLVFVSIGYHSPPGLWAIRPDGTGDVAKTAVVWKQRKDVPMKPSVLFSGGQLYVATDNGVASSLDARTGEPIWHGRIGTACTASPVLASGNVYFFTEQGECTVVRAGRTFEVVAKNALEGRCLASPAVSGDSLIVRTDSHLYRIARTGH